MPLAPQEQWVITAHEQLIHWKAAGYNPRLLSGPEGWVLTLETHPGCDLRDGRETLLRFSTAPQPNPAQAVYVAREVIK